MYSLVQQILDAICQSFVSHDLVSYFFFFFKQKTAYEISTDWSSDVCSSDLTGILRWYAFDPLAIDLKILALAVIAGLLAFRLHRSLIEVVGIMAALGIAV